jgi:pimeloyl-ACP methyl ester carboxylesterase
VVTRRQDHYNTTMPSLPRRASKTSIAPIVAATTTLAGVGLVLGWIAYSRTKIRHDLPLTAALDGELRTYDSAAAGLLAYYVGGPANPKSKLPPVLLIHSVNAAASSFEMRPLFERLIRTRRVYALELPGFGFSERVDRVYTPELMRDAILAMINGPLKGGPVDAVALSLGGEFLALAAESQPRAFRRLAFLSPTGFGRRAQSLRPNAGLLRFLRAPAWRRELFDLLTTRLSIGFFTRQSAKKPLPADFSDYAYETAHQPEAENAPYSFVSANLFTPNILDTYRDLKQPSLLIHGQDRFADFDHLEQVLTNPAWSVLPFDGAGALVHWDFPELVHREIETHFG